MSEWLDSLDPELRALVLGFEVECREHVEALTDALLRLPEADEKLRPELISVAFRATHSVKGGAASLQLDAVAQLAHAMETLLAKVRKEGGSLAPGEQGLLLEGGDLLLDTLRSSLAGTPIPETAPLLAALETGENRPPRRVAVERRSESGGDEDRTLRVDLGRLDRLTSGTAGLLVAKSQALDRARQAGEVAELVANLVRLLPEGFEQLGLAGRSATLVQREAERLEGTLSRDAMRIDLLADQLLESIQGIRLTPLGTTFQSMRRVAQDAARRVGKEIDLQLSGDQVEFDKQVLDALKDPLTHLIRNAVDHGIEAADEREAAGKPRSGKILLRCGQVGARVALEVADDGRGLDLEALKRAAVRSGARTQAEVDALGPDRAIELMTLPGVSTREAVGELSGRGVGLDVVRRNVETVLHGSLSVRSVQGRGTTFTIIAPVSISTVNGLLFELEGGRLAVLATTVERVLRLRDAEIESIEGRPAVRDPEGGFVDLVDLGAHLSLSPVRPRKFAIVLAHADRRMAFSVDAILGEQQLVFKPLWPPSHRSGAVVGGAILGGDEPLVVLGTAELLGGRRSEGAIVSSSTDEETRLDVLVVDDSITTRTLEASILKKHGCHVRLATNGEEALRELRKALPDVVVSDVEMPILDGLSLCRAIRADPALASVPILLVTSLSSSEERAAGLEAGADAYLEKGTFDQENFLSTLRRLGGRG